MYTRCSAASSVIDVHQLCLAFKLKKARKRAETHKHEKHEKGKLLNGKPEETRKVKGAMLKRGKAAVTTV